MPDETMLKPVAPAPKAPAPKPAGLRDAGVYVVTDARDSVGIPADDAQLAAMLRGERPPLSERRMRWFEPGAVVRGWPAGSVAGDLAVGIIRKASAEEAAGAVTVGGAA